MLASESRAPSYLAKFWHGYLTDIRSDSKPSPPQGACVRSYVVVRAFLYRRASLAASLAPSLAASVNASLAARHGWPWLLAELVWWWQYSRPLIP